MTLNSTASTAAPMKLIIPIAFKNFGIARSRLNLSAKLTSEGSTATNCRAVISERVPDKDPQSSFHGKKNSCGADFIKIRYRHVYPPANRTALPAGKPNGICKRFSPRNTRCAFPAGGKISARFTKKTAAATVSGSESFRFYLNAKYFSLIAFIRPLIALSVARAFSFSLSVPKKTRFMSRPSSKHASL